MAVLGMKIGVCMLLFVCLCTEHRVQCFTNSLSSSWSSNHNVKTPIHLHLNSHDHGKREYRQKYHITSTNPLLPISTKWKRDGAITTASRVTSLSLSQSAILTDRPFSPFLKLAKKAGPGLGPRDAASLAAGIVLLISYHAHLFRREGRGSPTWRTVQADTRERWSRYVRKTEGWLYAVQTLRNAITANTFLATTVLSLLTLIAGRAWDLLRKTAGDHGTGFDAGSAGAMGRTRLVVQFVSISVCMLTSAYEFLQSARLMTHAGFMFPVSTGTKVDEIMRRSQFAQWKGLRWLYLSIGVITWILGGEGMFLFSTICLVQFFRSVDEPPRDLEVEE